MADKTADAAKFLLRLPKSLHRRLLQQAKRNNVSLNTEIVNQLEGYEVATVKRTTEIMQPLLKEAVNTAVLDMVPLAFALQPRTKAELEKAILRIFRERQAGLSSTLQPSDPDIGQSPDRLVTKEPKPK